MEDGLYFVGVAVMKSWEFVANPLATEHCDNMQAMMGLATPRTERNRQYGYVSFRCSAVASVITEHRLDEECLTFDALGDYLSATIDDNTDMHVHHGLSEGEGPHQLHDLLQKWREQFSIPEAREASSWHGKLQMARLLSCGAWPGDVGAVLKRQQGYCDFFRLLPDHPPRAAVLNYLKTLEPVTATAERRGMAPLASGKVQSKFKRRGFIKMYDPGHKIRQLRARKDLRGKSLIRGFLGHCDSVISYLDPDCDSVVDLRGDDPVDDPSYNTYLRTCKQFDVATRMMERHLEVEESIYHINFDSSPQHGLEILGCVEECIPRGILYNKRFEDLGADTFEDPDRMLACLGQGRSGQLDKCAALIHQRWCKHGPAVKKVEHVNKNTYIGNADMGVELSVGDMPNITHQVIKQEKLAPNVCRKVGMLAGRQAIMLGRCSPNQNSRV